MGHVATVLFCAVWSVWACSSVGAQASRPKAVSQESCPEFYRLCKKGPSPLAVELGERIYRTFLSEYLDHPAMQSIDRRLKAAEQVHDQIRSRVVDARTAAS